MKLNFAYGCLMLLLSGYGNLVTAADTESAPSPDIGNISRSGDAVSGNAPTASPDPGSAEPALVVTDQAAPQNEIALQAWQNSGLTPDLVKNPDGSTRIEWRFSGSVDRHNTQVKTDGDPRLNSQLRSGQQYKSVIQMDARAVSPDGQVKHFQFNQTNSNDPSVISNNLSQITLMQAGWAGTNYHAELGDLMLSQSTLGSTLSMRGLSGNYQLDQLSFGAFSGVITESWEALDQRQLRFQLLRYVQGGKLSYNLQPGLNIYGTWQHYSDSNSSAPNSLYTASAWRANTSTLGFRWQHDDINLSGEAATSNSMDSTGEKYNGKAAIIDATYQLPTISLRSGYHYLDSDYKSLSYSATPGVNEGYVGGDWTASEWVVLGVDLRNTENTTPSQPFFPSQTSQSRSITSKANINFWNKIPGLTLTMQHTEANGKDANELSNHNSNFNALLGYSAASWTTSGNLGHQRITNKAYSTGDSTINTFRFNAGKRFTHFEADQTPIWTLGINLELTRQLLKLDTGGSSLNNSYSVRASFEHTKGTKVSLYWLGGRLTQPTIGPELRQKTWEVDASHPVIGRHAIKLFAREYQRNLGVKSLATTERVGGTEFAYVF